MGRPLFFGGFLPWYGIPHWQRDLLKFYHSGYYFLSWKGISYARHAWPK